jgi:hypothetical protein
MEAFIFLVVIATVFGIAAGASVVYGGIVAAHATHELPMVIGAARGDTHIESETVGVFYPVWFHCFATAADAHSLACMAPGSRVSKVRIRGVVAEGADHMERKVVVAREIMFSKEESCK